MMAVKERILVVDDEVPLLSVLTEMLSEQGYAVMGLSSPTEALEAISEGEFALLLTDLVMPQMDGIGLIREASEKDPRLVSIVMTGQGDIPSAVAAMKAGALDYITKPFKRSTLLPALERALDVRHLRVDNSQLCETLAIHELGKILAHTVDLDSILNKIVDVAMQQTVADEASIMIPCSDGRELRIAAVRGNNRERLLDQCVPVVSGVAGWVMQHREPLILDGVVTEQLFSPLYPRSDVRSAISIPMLIGGKTAGVLNVNATDKRHAFNKADVRALMSLASMAAPVIENARLYAEMREAERKYRAIFENALNGLFRARPDGRYIAVNPALARMFGHDSPEQMIASVTDVGRQIYDDLKRYAQIKSILDQEGEVRGRESRVLRRDGATFWVSENIRAVRDSQGVLLYYEGVVEDISKRRQDEARIRYLSYHDKLTGLHNRAYFEEEAKRLNTKQSLPLSLILGDVNGLKLVNDAFGHSKGNELLYKTAQLLKRCSRREDVLARWGGDEFAILLPRTSYEDAVKLSQRIIRACERSRWGSVPLSISLGLATKTEIRQSFKELLKQVEDNLFRRKLLEGRSVHSAIIASLRKTLWESSHETEEHAERLRQLAVGFGLNLGLSAGELDELSLLATLHDIGKIGIPDYILEKPGPLDPAEWEVMKQHPEIGSRIVQSSAELAVVAKAVLAHHERWDGTGYPQGLAGDSILRSARILSIVDAYDVITHGRPYKKAMDSQYALAEIARCADQQFDPNLARRFVQYMAQGYHQQKIYRTADCAVCPSRSLCAKAEQCTMYPVSRSGR